MLRSFPAESQLKMSEEAADGISREALVGDKSEKVSSKDGGLGDTLLLQTGEDDLEEVADSKRKLQSGGAPSEEELQSEEEKDDGQKIIAEKMENSFRQHHGVSNPRSPEKASKPPIQQRSLQKLGKLAASPFLTLQSMFKKVSPDETNNSRDKFKAQERKDNPTIILGDQSTLTEENEKAQQPASMDWEESDQKARTTTQKAEENLSDEILETRYKLTDLKRRLKDRTNGSRPKPSAEYLEHILNSTRRMAIFRPSNEYLRKMRERDCNKFSKHALPAVKAEKTENLSENPTVSQTHLALTEAVKALGGTQDIAEGFAERLEACSTEEQLDVCLTSLQQELWPKFKGTLTEWKDHVQSIRTKIQGRQRRERYLEQVTIAAQKTGIVLLEDEL